MFHLLASVEFQINQSCVGYKSAPSGNVYKNIFIYDKLAQMWLETFGNTSALTVWWRSVAFILMTKKKKNNKLSYKHAVNVMEAQSKAVFFFVIINTCDDKNIL